MNLTNDGSRWQLVIHTFMQGDVAASQTDVQLTLAETIGSAAAHSTLAVDSYVAPWDGDIVGIAYTLSAAGTTGTFTIGATKNGTENATSTVTVGTTTEGYKSLPRGTMPIVAGDNIGAEITTAAGWDGTTADLAVQVYVLYRLAGI